MENIDYKAIAKQLSHPEGEDGIKTGNLMQQGNAEMCNHTITLLDVQIGDYILEIGPGNGSHVSGILSKEENIHYSGIDVSETMVSQAIENNKNNNAEFILGNGTDLSYPDNYFDKIFTVNTLYFWQDTAAVLAEIKRVMKPHGRFFLAFRSEDFMKNLPFTQFGFTLYSQEKATEILVKAGFKIIDSIQVNEGDSPSIIGVQLSKDRIIITSGKDN
jgi:ubiquinone/menaquinone biosynthesis C-methylase UbiE